MPLSEAIYPRKCLDEAIAAYSGLCSVEVAEVSSEACIIEIKPKAEIEAEGTRIAYEFMNYLLDLSLESHLRRAPNSRT
jgi:hypothetical protein